MPALEVRHYVAASGRDVIAAFLDDLPSKAAAKCSAKIERLESGDIHLYPKNRTHLRPGIWEPRVPFAGEQYRFRYAVDGSVVDLLSAIHTKTQKIDEQDIRLAERRRAEMASGRSPRCITERTWLSVSSAARGSPTSAVRRLRSSPLGK